MPIKTIQAHLQNYLAIAIVLGSSWFVSNYYASTLATQIRGSSEHAETLIVLSSLVVVFALGFIIYELARPTFIPSFVLAMFFGIVAKNALLPLVSNVSVLLTVITIGAALILFGGGLDTPFHKFRNLIGPILSLACIGTIITAFTLALFFQVTGEQFGLILPLSTWILLSAAIASTDPAAIIPSFQSLLFIKPRVKYIAVSESAINDVISVVLVGLLLEHFTQGFTPLSVFATFSYLGSLHNILLLVLSLSVGIGAGVLGYGILVLWSHWKSQIIDEEGADAALFLAVPLFVYTLATLLHGSGFLAVFLSSLLFRMRTHVRQVEHYFNHTIEAFMKPMLFMLLGAMVDPATLLDLAPMGILTGFFFMFILRPLVVGITLFPFCFGRDAISIRELLFLSFVRETGVISAVLLITLTLLGIPGMASAMAIGFWVILLTLTIEPPLTPLLAEKLGITTLRGSMPDRTHIGPVAVLCSRGYSFPERMDTVVEWAIAHSVENIILLHCPEEKYAEKFNTNVRDEAEKLFQKINNDFIEEGQREMNFKFMCREGLLQDSIESLIATGDVSIIFVGSKMLDYRMEDVKNLSVPFYFM